MRVSYITHIAIAIEHTERIRQKKRKSDLRSLQGRLWSGAWKTKGGCKTRRQDEKTGRMLPKGYIQTDEEMDESNLVVSNNHMYRNKKDAANAEVVQNVVNYIAKDLYNIPKMISFSDTELVKSVVDRYLASCQRSNVLPTNAGLARACGCAYSTFRKYIQRHPGHPTAVYLEIVLDGFSEALAQSSLRNAVNPIYGIFTQKTDYGKRENEPVAEPREDLLGEVITTDELEKKYAEMED